jgi:Right handed beta helix region
MIVETCIKRCAVCACVAISSFCTPTRVAAEATIPNRRGERAHFVPAEHSTIQAAIDAAEDGDTVLVSPGVYHESVRIGGKSVRLVSEFDRSGDKQAVRRTIFDGATTDATGRVGVVDQVILVEPNAGPETEIVGFTIRNGDDGISCHAHARIAHNFFTANDDAIDYEGGGGVCEFNKFEKNRDDAVDYDGDCDATVVHNEIANNEDDGVEIRLQPYRGKTLRLTIRENVITGNGEDGIQIIDYPGISDRRIRIERNVIARNAMAGIGCMGDAVTKEDYRAANIPEPIEIINNTIADNEYGVTGGDNLVAFNNVVVGNRQLGLKQVDGRSLASHNLFWANEANFDVASNVRDEHTLVVDPQLDSEYRPRVGSPCFGAGVSRLSTPGGDVTASSSASAAVGCDLGAFSANSDQAN